MKSEHFLHTGSDLVCIETVTDEQMCKISTRLWIKGLAFCSVDMVRLSVYKLIHIYDFAVTHTV